MEEEKIVDQSGVAQSVADKIPYEFFDYFLVKPLEPIKVKKEFSKPVSAGTPVKDANGIEAQDFNDVETEVIEVDSDYRKGIVIKCPTYHGDSNVKTNVNVGDIVIYRHASSRHFDLLKDSRLLKLYDILGIEK